jgi:hypothetical protein
MRVEYDPGSDLPMVHFATSEVPAERLGLRRRLLSTIQGLDRGSQDPPPARLWDRFSDDAFALLLSREVQAAFDLEAELGRVRDRYGRFRFGQACLLARRLAEVGVPFIQVNWSTDSEAEEDAGDGGWDMHYRLFEVLQDRHLWMFDRALSALLEDLHDRGLLDTVLVVAVGEFGRTPVINRHAGRDHWEKCYSALLAGGGVVGGRVIGASTKGGEFPVDRPLGPADLAATMLDRLGVTREQLRSTGLEPSGAVIRDLF